MNSIGDLNNKLIIFFVNPIIGYGLEKYNNRYTFFNFKL